MLAKPNQWYSSELWFVQIVFHIESGFPHTNFLYRIRFTQPQFLYYILYSSILFSEEACRKSNLNGVNSLCCVCKKIYAYDKSKSLISLCWKNAEAFFFFFFLRCWVWGFFCGWWLCLGFFCTVANFCIVYFEMETNDLNSASCLLYTLHFFMCFKTYILYLVKILHKTYSELILYSAVGLWYTPFW